MLRMIVAMIALGVAGIAPAAIPTSSVVLPAYEKVPFASDYASRAAYREAVADPRFVMERISYRSDGLEVYAYVYRPVRTGKKLPVIIFNRGSWTWPGFAGELVTMARRLASKGYVVVAPMYRGSGGAAGRDELGGDDLHDLFNLLPVLGKIPSADSSRLYLYGESRGGMMVYEALRDGFPARAAAVVGAFTSLEGMLQNPQWLAAGRSIWPDLETNRAAIAQRRSAVLWADRITRPVLIIHGAKDPQVPVAQSLDLAHKLTALDKPYQLLVVEGQGHTISGRLAERDAWVLDWFARH